MDLIIKEVFTALIIMEFITNMMAVINILARNSVRAEAPAS